jgi:hypothetical protein
MVKASKLYKKEDGSGLLLCIFVLFVMLGVGGLAVDTGILYKTKGEMRKAANAAVLSGAQDMFETNDTITDVVNYVLEAHKEKESLNSLAIKPNGENKLTVTLKKDVPLYFMKIFGITSAPVSVASSAKVGPLGAAGGAVPLGVPLTVLNNLKYKEEYVLKVGPGDSEYGNFGILALTGPGAKLYEDDLKTGFDGEIKIGQIIPTETGNKAGPTEEAVEYRLDKSLNKLQGLPSGELDLNDPRLLKVLVYKEASYSGNQLTTVEVVGFAYFYLKIPASNHDYKTLSGYFIQGVESGLINENAAEKGAYAIRLVE